MDSIVSDFASIAAKLRDIKEQAVQPEEKDKMLERAYVWPAGDYVGPNWSDFVESAIKSED